MEVALDTLKTKLMAAPDPQQSQWAILISNLLPWATIFGLGYAAIYFVFRYFSESRDKRLVEIVNERLEPLEGKIDKLLVDVANLKSK